MRFLASAALVVAGALFAYWAFLATFVWTSGSLIEWAFVTAFGWLIGYDVWDRFVARGAGRRAVRVGTLGKRSLPRTS
jgi:hypothetical protein